MSNPSKTYFRKLFAGIDSPISIFWRIANMSLNDEKEDTRIYKVVVNDEEQYSIWFSERELPLGWREVGKSGRKEECLSYIKEVWTDMRPLSLRKKMQEAGLC